MELCAYSFGFRYHKPRKVSAFCILINDFPSILHHITDQRGRAMSEHRLLQSKRRERIAPAYPGGHVRGPTAAHSHVHTTLASRLLPDQSVLRQGRLFLLPYVSLSINVAKYV